MKRFPFRNIFFLLATAVIFSSCSHAKGNVGRMQSFSYAEIEASWIRNGEPIEYDNKQWHPLDDVEALQDFEVLWVGRYQNVDFYVAKLDVKPYNRLYTKFGANQYRPFEVNKNDQH